MSNSEQDFQKKLDRSPKMAPVLYPESERHKFGHISQTRLTELNETTEEARHTQTASVSDIMRSAEHIRMKWQEVKTQG